MVRKQEGKQYTTTQGTRDLVEKIQCTKNSSSQIRAISRTPLFPPYLPSNMAFRLCRITQGTEHFTMLRPEQYMSGGWCDWYRNARPPYREAAGIKGVAEDSV